MWSMARWNADIGRTLAVVAIMPNALNVSYSNRSSTFSSRFPMNRFAPTSSCFLSEDAYVSRTKWSYERF